MIHMGSRITPITTDRFPVSRRLKVLRMKTAMDIQDLVPNCSSNQAIKVQDRALQHRHRISNFQHVKPQWILPRRLPQHQVKSVPALHNCLRSSLLPPIDLPVRLRV